MIGISLPFRTTDETVVYLSNINPRPRTHIEVGVDAEDYYGNKA